MRQQARLRKAVKSRAFLAGLQLSVPMFHVNGFQEKGFEEPPCVETAQV
jgi:hypothetical protein